MATTKPRDKISQISWRMTCVEFTAVLTATNPNFDIDRFLRACNGNGVNNE